MGVRVAIIRDAKGSYLIDGDCVKEGTPEAEAVRSECEYYGYSDINGHVEFYEKKDKKKIYGSSD